MTHRRLALGLVAIGIATLLLVFFWPASDQEKMRKQVEALGASVSHSESIESALFWGGNLNKKFQDLLTDPVEVIVEDRQLALPRERRALALSSAQYLARYSRLEVSFSNFEIDASSLQVRVTAQLSASSGGQERYDERPLRIQFVKTDGDFKMSSIRIEPPERD